MLNFSGVFFSTLHVPVPPQPWENNGSGIWMMQFPYFSSDKGGRPLQSLLGDPQDVLRKKSEQSCTFALRTREVFNREACTAVPRLCWCPRGSSWSVWLCLPSRRPRFFNDFFLLLLWLIGNLLLLWIKLAVMKEKWKHKKTGNHWNLELFGPWNLMEMFCGLRLEEKR